MDFDEDSDYLDLDDILAQTQSLRCMFLLNIPGLEFLSPDKVEEVKQGTVISLPFWMTKTLYTYGMIDVQVPENYAAKFRDIAEAEAQVVDLHRAGPHYYRFGKLLMGLRREKGNDLDPFTKDGQRNRYKREAGETLAERRSIASSLIETFHSRRHKLLDYSINKAAFETPDKSFESRLDNLERELLKLGRQQVDAIKRWNSRKIEMIGNNMIAARLSKRRKLEEREAAAASAANRSSREPGPRNGQANEYGNGRM